jgi:heme exporter protein A
MAPMSLSEHPQPLLRVSDLAVSRGGRQLFSGIGFALARGQVLLLRGPNGAGKSSLLLALAGVLRPSAGTIRYSGGGTEELAPNLHFVGHQTGVKTRLTLSENLAFWAAMFGRSPSPTTAAVGIAEALERVRLGGKGELDAGYLSAGQTRRLALARLLVTDRPIWLLDEPTAALDADGEQLVASLIEERIRTGGAVIAATHDDIAIATATVTLGGAT